MTNFNMTIGAPTSTRMTVTASKYTVAPRTNQFEATVNGKTCPAWTTEGRGSHYVYFKSDSLYYVKMAGPGELAAARQSLVVTTDEWEETQPTRLEKPAKARKPRVARAKA